MPTPKDPPANVRPSDKTRKHVGVLSAIELDTKLTDMRVCQDFQERMSPKAQTNELEDMLRPGTT